MSQQCGNCKWWDAETKVLNNPFGCSSDCNAPVPESVRINLKHWMLETDGKNCQAYEERKECEE